MKVLDIGGRGRQNDSMTTRHQNCDHPSTKAARATCRKSITTAEAIARADALFEELRLERELSPAAWALHKEGKA